jgi:acetyltransferase-like isoleucine patch superfamily enzyme
MSTPPDRPDRPERVPWDRDALWRFAWGVVSFFLVESLVFGLAVLPAVLFWTWHFEWPIEPRWVRVLLLAMSFVPTYLVFAFTLMALSALATRVLGWRPPRHGEMRIADLDWDLLNWARYGMTSHVVRVFAGGFLRSTPVWVWYMRLNGARIGHRCWINSLEVRDDCLLELGDDVVIGGGVHLSGHTVERGVVRTAPVRLGSGTVVGVGSHVEIGVETGPRCQIGSLSMVPKFSRLEGDATWVGRPVRKLEKPADPP